jgi:hypothetical protein
MKIIDGMWKLLNSRLIGYVILGILALFLIGTCSRNSGLKDDIERQKNNIYALTDTIRNQRTSSGELRASIQGYIANAKELEAYNKELADQVKAETGKVITLNNIVFRLQQDTAQLKQYIDSLLTIIHDPVQVNDSTWYIDWTLSYTYDANNYDRYSGRTVVGVIGDSALLKDIKLSHNGTSLLNRDSQMKITWGQTMEGKGLRVFAQTAHPAFKAQLLEGVYVDYGTKRRWFTGFGVGPQAGTGWSFIQGKPTLYLGIGVQYNVYQW